MNRLDIYLFTPRSAILFDQIQINDPVVKSIQPGKLSITYLMSV